MFIKLLLITFGLTFCFAEYKDCKKTGMAGFTEQVYAIDSMNLDNITKSFENCDEADVYQYMYKYKNMDYLDFVIASNDSDTLSFFTKKYPKFVVTKERIFRYFDKSSINHHDPDIIELLLNLGNFDVNIVDKDGKTMLHHVIVDPQDFEVKYLLKKGIDINIKDNTGLTVLDEAKRNILINEELYKKTDYDENIKRANRIKRAVEMIEKMKK